MIHFTNIEKLGANMHVHRLISYSTSHHLLSALLSVVPLSEVMKVVESLGEGIGWYQV